MHNENLVVNVFSVHASIVFTVSYVLYVCAREHVVTGSRVSVRDTEKDRLYDWARSVRFAERSGRKEDTAANKRVTKQSK